MRCRSLPHAAHVQRKGSGGKRKQKAPEAEAGRLVLVVLFVFGRSYDRSSRLVLLKSNFIERRRDSGFFRSGRRLGRSRDGRSRRLFRQDRGSFLVLHGGSHAVPLLLIVLFVLVTAAEPAEHGRSAEQSGSRADIRIGDAELELTVKAHASRRQKQQRTEPLLAERKQSAQHRQRRRTKDAQRLRIERSEVLQPAQIRAARRDHREHVAVHQRQGDADDREKKS